MAGPSARQIIRGLGRVSITVEEKYIEFTPDEPKSSDTLYRPSTHAHYESENVARSGFST